MNLRKKLTLALLALALSLGTQSIAMSQASANPFGALVKSRKGGKRTHKKAGKSSSKDEKSDSKKRTTTSRRVVRRTTRPSSTNTTRTRHYRRPANSTSSTSRRRTSSTRTVRNVRPRTTSTRTVRNVRPRTSTTRTRTTTTTRVRRGSTSRRTYYRQGATRTHSHTHVSSGSTHRRGARVRDTSGSTAVEAYLTGGLGVSGFAANEITDLPLPGAGYDLALGAKGKYVGGELSLNGGGYTFDPGSGSTDIAMIGLSGDLKLQPSFGFFEPYVSAGIGGYALKDAVIEEGATGLGLRLGLGADFRFRQVAVRVKYQHGSYGLNDVNGQYGGDLTAHTETLGANLVVYF